MVPVRGVPVPVDDVPGPAGLTIGRAEASWIGNHTLTLPSLWLLEHGMKLHVSHALFVPTVLGVVSTMVRPCPVPSWAER